MQSARSARPRDRGALWMDRPGETCGNGNERNRWHAAAFRQRTRSDSCNYVWCRRNDFGCDQTRCEENHYRPGWQRDQRWRFWNGARFGISVFCWCKGADRSSDRTDATHEDRFAGKRSRGAYTKRPTKKQAADTAAATTSEHHSGGGREECVAGREWCDTSVRSTERSKQGRPR